MIVDNIKKDTIQILVYSGEVTCENIECKKVNSIVQGDKDSIVINCSTCGKEIDCEWD